MPYGVKRVKLTSATPSLSYYISVGQQLLIGEASTENKELKSVPSQEIALSPLRASLQYYTATSEV